MSWSREWDNCWERAELSERGTEAVKLRSCYADWTQMIGDFLELLVGRGAVQIWEPGSRLECQFSVRAMPVSVCCCEGLVCTSLFESMGECACWQ